MPRTTFRSKYLCRRLIDITPGGQRLETKPGQATFKRLIGQRHALLLTQIIQPGLDDKTLDVVIGFAEVTIKSPVLRAVAPP